MADLSSLIEKLEQAREGSRELDWAIALHLGQVTSQSAYCPLYFTTSLDAALTLVDEDWWWHISHIEAWVTPTVPADGMRGLVSNAVKYDGDKPIRYSANIWKRGGEAKALVTATLKARKEMDHG